MLLCPAGLVVLTTNISTNITKTLQGMLERSTCMVLMALEGWTLPVTRVLQFGH